MLTTKIELRRTRVEDRGHELQPVEPEEDPGAERDEQDRGRREPERTHRGARVELAETGEEEGEERGGERRARSRRCLLRRLHRG